MAEEPDDLPSTASLGGASPGRLPERGLGGRRKRRPERHDEILLASVRLFHANGYHATTIDSIANAVGVSATAIYRHFRNKQEILDTAALWVGEQVAQKLFAIDSAAPAQTRLEQFVDHLVTTAVSHPNFVAMLVRELHALSPNARAVSLGRRARYVEEFCGTLREVAPAHSGDEIQVRIHLVIAMICSVTTFGDHASEWLRSSLRRTALAVLLAPAA